MSFEHIGVLGSGSWGTALALLLESNGLKVTLWGRDAAQIQLLAQERTNSTYLPGVMLPARLGLTADLAALAGCDLLLVVTPSRGFREMATRISRMELREGAVLLSCTKGVERGTGKRMSEILAELLPQHPRAVLSGPSHAEEVATRRPAAVVLGCGDQTIGRRLQKAFSTPFFRGYTNADVAGVELGGALKNIYALAAGVSDGLGLGDNSKAALVTRALAELVRLGVALGGSADTFQGLSGLGDLMVTCFSPHSRNRRVGERLGRGESLASITASMQMVAEGVPTTYSAIECASRHGIKTPIADQVRAILDGEAAPEAALHALLTRELKAE